jgi:long-chain acyl-CoA synthetase
VFIADAAILAGLNDLQGLASASSATLKVFAAHQASGVAARFPAWEAARDALSASSAVQGPQRGAMFYTSGTTGRPKGIRRKASTPEQVAAGMGVMRHCMGFDPETYGPMRALVSAPMYHSAPNSFSLGAALFNVDLHIEERFDAEDTLRLIAEHRITHAYLVPTMYVRMLRLPQEVKQKYDLSSMRFVGSTGSPCSPDVKRAMVEWWGPVIYESYGSSELGYMTRLDSPDALRKPGSAGKALPGVVLEILGDDGQPLPAGESGLIYAHNPAVADFTYTGNEAARRKMEVQGLKTMGDVGYLDDEGFLFIVDRSADMVISGGVNIYPAEIEAVLQMMPGVADCAVFGIPSDEFGEALGCAIQRADTASGATLNEAAVQGFLKERLASFKVPQVVAFHEALPREDTGKIFKRKLREPYWAGKTRRI